MICINNKPSNMNPHIHSIHLLTVRHEWSVQAVHFTAWLFQRYSTGSGPTPGQCVWNLWWKSFV